MEGTLCVRTVYAWWYAQRTLRFSFHRQGCEQICM